MFGPGLEDLDESLVYKMMTSPEILPLAGPPSRQIHGNTSLFFLVYLKKESFKLINVTMLILLTSCSVGSSQREIIPCSSCSDSSVDKDFTPKFGEIGYMY